MQPIAFPVLERMHFLVSAETETTLDLDGLIAPLLIHLSVQAAGTIVRLRVPPTLTSLHVYAYRVTFLANQLQVPLMRYLGVRYDGPHHRLPHLFPNTQTIETDSEHRTLAQLIAFHESWKPTIINGTPEYRGAWHVCVS
jgi:hypothetical protein